MRHLLTILSLLLSLEGLAEEQKPIYKGTKGTLITEYPEDPATPPAENQVPKSKWSKMHFDKGSANPPADPSTGDQKTKSKWSKMLYDKGTADSYKNCVWSKEFAPKVAKGPGGKGCSKGSDINLCIGVVVCENAAGLKIQKQVICSASQCSDQHAESCLLDESYSLTTPEAPKAPSKAPDHSGGVSKQ